MTRKNRSRVYATPSLAAWGILLAAICPLPLGAHADADPCADDVHEVTVNYTPGFFDFPDGDTCSIAALIANPGEGGHITLDEAITAANNTPGPDVITVTALGTHTPSFGTLSLSDMTGGTTIIRNPVFMHCELVHF